MNDTESLETTRCLSRKIKSSSLDVLSRQSTSSLLTYRRHLDLEMCARNRASFRNWVKWLLTHRREPQNCHPFVSAAMPALVVAVALVAEGCYLQGWPSSFLSLVLFFFITCIPLYYLVSPLPLNWSSLKGRRDSFDLEIGLNNLLSMTFRQQYPGRGLLCYDATRGDGFKLGHYCGRSYQPINLN